VLDVSLHEFYGQAEFLLNLDVEFGVVVLEAFFFIVEALFEEVHVIEGNILESLKDPFNNWCC